MPYGVDRALHAAWSRGGQSSVKQKRNERIQVENHLLVEDLPGLFSDAFPGLAERSYVLCLLSDT